MRVIVTNEHVTVATSCKKILGKDVPVVEVTGAQLKEALKAMGSSDFYANAGECQHRSPRLPSHPVTMCDAL